MPLEFVTADAAAAWPDGTYVLCASARAYGMQYEVAQKGRNLEWHFDHAQRFARLPDRIDGVDFPPRKSVTQFLDDLREASGGRWDAVDPDEFLREMRGDEWEEKFASRTRKELFAAKAWLDAALARLPEEPPPSDANSFRHARGTLALPPGEDSVSIVRKLRDS